MPKPTCLTYRSEMADGVTWWSDPDKADEHVKTVGGFVEEIPDDVDDDETLDNFEAAWNGEEGFTRR
jgi:hypothetical protein